MVEACVPIVIVFCEAHAVDQSTMNTETITAYHVIASDFRLSTGQRQAIRRLGMSRELSRDDRCSTQQHNV